MIMAAAQFGGELLDTQMGLSVAASFDPASGSSVNMMRRMKFYLAMIIYLCLDGHHFLIRAMFKSFEIVPVTGCSFGKDLITQLVKMTGQIFYLGIQIAAPSLAALFMTQIGLGLLARVAPQMNVFMLSFPLNIAVGLTLISASLYILMKSYQIFFMMNNETVMNTVKVLAPVPK
jgi:flagellar biosynthetic protein FliR